MFLVSSDFNIYFILYLYIFLILKKLMFCFCLFNWNKLKFHVNPGGSNPQSSSCAATYHSSRKLSKLDEPDMQDITGEVRTSDVLSWPLHMTEQRQDDQLEPTHTRSVPIRDVALKTCRKQWAIGGGERGSGISVLMVQHDDDDDDDLWF